MIKFFQKKNSLFFNLTDNNLIEEERRKLEDKLNKNFGIIDNEKFQCDLLKKKINTLTIFLMKNIKK